MYKVKVPSDRYHAKKKKLEKEYEGMGFKPNLYPVDMNGAYVPMDKSDDNLEVMSKCIQKQYGLTEGGV